MKKILSTLSLLALAAITTGCSFAARSADMYAEDTANLLTTRNDQIKSCYDEALKNESSIAGDVVVSFTVEKKTGAILNPALVRERTTAPEALGQCVVGALNGLVLDPPDQSEGAGVFTWKFVVNEPVQAEAAPAAG